MDLRWRRATNDINSDQPIQNHDKDGASRSRGDLLFRRCECRIEGCGGSGDDNFWKRAAGDHAVGKFAAVVLPGHPLKIQQERSVIPLSGRPDIEQMLNA